MNKILRALGLSPLCFAAAFCVYGAEDPIKVKVLPDQTVVTLGIMFLTKVQVRNASENGTDFWAETCSFDKQWVTDRPGLFIQPWTCEENGIEQIQLAPGDVYEKSVVLYVPEQEKSGPVTFRLGFKRMNENGDEAAPVWSDPVTVRVIVPGGASSRGIAAVQKVPALGSPQADSGLPRTYTDPTAPIRVRPGATFSISLTSNPSTGYVWKMDFPEEKKGLMFLGSKQGAVSAPMAGAPGNQVYTFRALKTGETKIKFVYERPWNPSNADTREIFTVIVQEP